MSLTGPERAYKMRLDRAIRCTEQWRERHGYLPDVESLAGLCNCGQVAAGDALLFLKLDQARLSPHAIAEVVADRTADDPAATRH